MSGETAGRMFRAAETLFLTVSGRADMGVPYPALLLSVVDLFVNCRRSRSDRDSAAPPGGGTAGPAVPRWCESPEERREWR